MTNQTVSDHPASDGPAVDPHLSADHLSADHLTVDRPSPDCPVEITLAALRGRWTTLVVRELFGGARGYGELAAALALSDKVLADRLAQLVAHGVVERVRTPGWPSRVTYTLTPRGERLRGVLDAMWEWGAA
ncbi:helix-turn-helix domain-containing protein [Actinosynnema sp. NPDC047251]|uniref:winged helix-turn-helix transcriptional regulator n=1 Tax=Saccharothrix espanaensis TaxID=103731 RepID=UPI0003188F85|nr:helix-turn-helix domain-containing protein [Saccharothrix espanaensis]